MQLMKTRTRGRVAVVESHTPAQILCHLSCDLITRIWGLEVLVHQGSAVMNELCIIRVVKRALVERSNLSGALISQSIRKFVGYASNMLKGDDSRRLEPNFN